ncbi:oligosaccharide flippase family protein [Porticoccaceae bacterium]|nr:oligosaccharide flippase family protein [Porticoccaceae bacterium]
MFSNNLILKFIAVFLTYGQTLILARLLTVAEFGLFSTLLATVNIFCTACLFGFPQLIQRNYRRHDDIAALQSASYLWVNISIILTAVLVITTNFIGQTLIQVSFLVSIFCISIVRLKAHELFGKGFLIAGQCADILLRPLLLIVLLLIYVYFEGSLISSNIFIIFTISCFLASMLLRLPIFNIRKGWSIDFRHLNEFFIYWRQGLPFFLISLVQILAINIWIILISHFQDSSEAGVFRISFVICLAFGLLREIIDMISRNKIIDVYLGKAGEGSKVINEVSRTYFLGAIVLVFGFSIYLAWGESIITKVFGSQYTQVFLISIPLVLARIFECLLGPFPIYIQVNGHEKTAVLISWCAFIVSIAFYAGSYEKLGLMSASIGFLIYTVVVRVSSYVIYKLSQIQKALISNERL